jgi:hypothetical protein
MIKLELSVDQVNIIMQALGNAAYVSVAPVIAEIQKQAGPQVQPASQPAPAEAE